MKKFKFGKIEMNPALNPAVLDCLTWNKVSVISCVKSRGAEFWAKANKAVRNKEEPPVSDGVRLYESSIGYHGRNAFVLSQFGDGQHAIVEFVQDRSQALLPSAFTQIVLPDGTQVNIYEANGENMHVIYRKAAPEKLPQALGMTPRIGIGTRMSRAVWPGVFKAMNECSFCANAIQNSLRELNLLENIVGGKVSKKLYYPGVGFVPEGHTGSTFEGLWVCGVSEALKAGVKQRYGADADHIMVKRGPNGLERAKKVLMAARHYSFFTIDVSDILDYSSFSDSLLAEASKDDICRSIPDDRTIKEMLTYYKSPVKIGRRSIKIGESNLVRVVGKYWRALEALDSLVTFLKSIREDEVFDLELSIDEHPPEIHPFDCLTSEVEVVFILEEMKRRGLRLTHIAPNLGVEKHVDYRYHDGLEGLEARTRAIYELAQEHGVVIDCHSGDDLSDQTRRTLKRATGGMIHFKISPYLQSLFGDVLYDFDRNVFKLWWDDTYEFVQENVRQGSKLAADCLREYESEPGSSPGPRFNLFRLYCYATVGKRDAQGNFMYREKFYSLSQEFYAEYTKRVKSYLCALAGDLFE